MAGHGGTMGKSSGDRSATGASPNRKPFLVIAGLALMVVLLLCALGCLALASHDPSDRGEGRPEAAEAGFVL